MSGIKDARTYESAIEIIPSVIVDQGLYFLHRTFVRLQSEIELPLVGMFVKKGGVKTGMRVLNGTSASLATITMSHTGPGNVYQAEAICLEKPDLGSILLAENVTAPIAVCDGIMETIGTLEGVERTVNKMIAEHNDQTGSTYPLPLYHYFVLVDKTARELTLENIHSAFRASTQIWYHGAGSDDKSHEGEERGREKPAIWGRLPDKFAGPLPEEPFYTQNF